MTISPEPRIIVKAGHRGSGKSHLAGHAARWLLDRGVTVIVSDPNGDFPTTLHDGSRVPVAGYFKSVNALARRVWLDQRAPSGSCAARGIYIHEGDNPDGCARAAWDLASRPSHRRPNAPDRPVALIVDEAADCDGLGTGARLKGVWRSIYAKARHRGVWLLLATQQPSGVCHRALRGADLVIAFRYSHADDLAALRAGGISEIGIRRIQQLPQHERIAAPMSLLTVPIPCLVENLDRSAGPDRFLDGSVYESDE